MLTCSKNTIRYKRIGNNVEAFRYYLVLSIQLDATELTLNAGDKVADNVEVYIGLSSWANIAGFVTAEVRCEVFNYNEDPILGRGLDVRPSSGGSNSNSASFAYWGYVNYGRSKYWLNNFTNIYELYYLVYFQYNNKMYTKIVDR